MGSLHIHPAPTQSFLSSLKIPYRDLVTMGSLHIHPAPAQSFHSISKIPYRDLLSMGSLHIHPAPSQSFTAVSKFSIGAPWYRAPCTFTLRLYKILLYTKVPIGSLPDPRAGWNCSAKTQGGGGGGGVSCRVLKCFYHA